MAHPLVRTYGEAHRQRASLNVVIISASYVRWVEHVQIVSCDAGFRVLCRISPWWWLLLGAWHAVVRRRVKRCLDGAFTRWPNPGVVSVWVL